jgi:hypothetical protein
MINAASFREKNPNYFFLSIDEKPFEDDLNNFEDKSSENDKTVTKQKAFCPLKEFLLCSKTIYGFYFITK